MDKTGLEFDKKQAGDSLDYGKADGVHSMLSSA